MNVIFERLKNIKIGGYIFNLKKNKMLIII